MGDKVRAAAAPAWVSTAPGLSRRCGQPHGRAHVGKRDVPWAPASCTSPHTTAVPQSIVTPVATGEAKTAGAQCILTQPERTKEAPTPSLLTLARSPQQHGAFPGHHAPPPPPGKRSRGRGLFPVQASFHPGTAESATWYDNAAAVPGKAFFTLGAQPGAHPLADKSLIESIRGSLCPSNPFHSLQP